MLWVVTKNIDILERFLLRIISIDILERSLLRIIDCAKILICVVLLLEHGKNNDMCIVSILLEHGKNNICL